MHENSIKNNKFSSVDMIADRKIQATCGSEPQHHVPDHHYMHFINPSNRVEHLDREKSSRLQPH